MTGQPDAARPLVSSDYEQEEWLDAYVPADQRAAVRKERSEAGYKPQPDYDSRPAAPPIDPELEHQHKHGRGSIAKTWGDWERNR